MCAQVIIVAAQPKNPVFNEIKEAATISTIKMLIMRVYNGSHNYIRSTDYFITVRARRL